MPPKAPDRGVVRVHSSSRQPQFNPVHVGRDVKIFAVQESELKNLLKLEFLAHILLSVGGIFLGVGATEFFREFKVTGVAGLAVVAGVVLFGAAIYSIKTNESVLDVIKKESRQT